MILKGNVILKPESTRGRAQLNSLFHHVSSETSAANQQAALTARFVKWGNHCFCMFSHFARSNSMRYYIHSMDANIELKVK